jgi:hypothetical protein
MKCYTTLWPWPDSSVNLYRSSSIFWVIKRRRNIAHIGDIRNAERILVGKFEMRRLLSLMSERNIKMDLKDTGCSGVDRVQLAQYRSDVNTAMYLRVSYKVGTELLSSTWNESAAYQMRPVLWRHSAHVPVCRVLRQTSSVVISGEHCGSKRIRRSRHEAPRVCFRWPRTTGLNVSTCKRGVSAGAGLSVREVSALVNEFTALGSCLLTPSHTSVSAVLYFRHLIRLLTVRSVSVAFPFISFVRLSGRPTLRALPNERWVDRSWGQ